jgi:hypothetical protein
MYCQQERDHYTTCCCCNYIHRRMQPATVHLQAPSILRLPAELAPYTYVWTATAGGIVPTGQANNQNLTGLVAGTYSVAVTDANGCTANKSVIITQPAAVATTATQVNATCYGTSTGSINLTVTGGTTPYTYVWTATAGGMYQQDKQTTRTLPVCWLEPTVWR